MSKQEPKSETEESNRMWASASFVGVLIIIGLPLWWKTTEVYRVSLPYDKISAFNELPSIITSELTVLANDEQTASEIVTAIQKAFEDEDILKLKIKKSIISDDLHRTLETVAEEQDAVEEVAAAFDLTQHNQFYVVQRRPLFQDVWLAGERVMFFRDTKASPTLIQALKQWVYQTKVLKGARTDVADAARRTRFPPAAAYHVVLSVVHPKPDKISVELDAREAVEDYIGSFVDELSVLHNFTLKSQWLYLLDFDFQAKEIKDNSERHFAVRQERLHLLLTSLEERAATHVSDLPTLNLALYAVPCQTAPLVIYDQTGDPVRSSVQAFMSPKWGGVVLSAPSRADCAAPAPTWRPNVRIIMGTFISQLRKLLGIAETAPIPGGFLSPLRSVHPRRWEVDTLLRTRTVEQLTNAQRTLQSLAQLLGEISNIVINDEVGASINSAVDSIHEASQLLASGRLVEAYRVSLAAHEAAETAFMEPSLLALLYFPDDQNTHEASQLLASGRLVEAYRVSLAAHEAAETAFMEPSLLALLYFPDDQKYAIYIPLFLPIMFPVVLSLKNLLLWFRGKPVHKEKIE